MGRIIKYSKTRTSFKLRVELGSGFLLLFALIYFFDDIGIIAALAPPVLAHETGHVLAMLLFGACPTRLCASLSGFSLDYSGDLSERQEMFTALSGPLLGFIFAVFCAKIGKLINSDYLLMSAGLGFIINTFNLLPAKPLDGERILKFALIKAIGANYAQIIMTYISFLITFLILGSGLFCISKGYGFSLFIAGIWLFILQQNNTCK